VNAEQIAAWKAAVAKHRRQQRQRRGKREKSGLPTVTGPGMVRVNPAQPKEQP
jgi:hypothetical protein